MCAPVLNQITQTEFGVKYKIIALLFFQAKGDKVAVENCVPTQGSLMKRFTVLAQGWGC